MAELADALDLGSSAARRMGSTPFIRTKGISSGSFRAIAFLLQLFRVLTYCLLSVTMYECFALESIGKEKKSRENDPVVLVY